MSPEARAIVETELFPELSDKGLQSKILNATYEVSYRWKPVDVVKFATGPEYLGPVLQGSIFPKLLDDLEELFEGGYTEVLLKGSIGWGKTTFGYIGIATTCIWSTA
jgi:hypothetical protein